jgi:hypothetical protein
MFAAEEAAGMPRRIKKLVPRKLVLRLPDLDHAKSSVLNSLSSPHSRRNYKFAMEQFITWYGTDVLSKHASGVEAARMRKKIKKPLRRKIVLRLFDSARSGCNWIILLLMICAGPAQNSAM